MVAGGCGAAAHPRTARVDHFVSNDRAEDLKAAELGSVAATGDKLRELAGKLQVRHLANVG